MLVIFPFWSGFDYRILNSIVPVLAQDLEFLYINHIIKEILPMLNTRIFPVSRLVYFIFIYFYFFHLSLFFSLKNLPLNTRLFWGHFLFFFQSNFKNINSNHFHFLYVISIIFIIFLPISFLFYIRNVFLFFFILFFFLLLFFSFSPPLLYPVLCVSFLNCYFKTILPFLLKL